MRSEVEELIRTNVCPLIASGEASLLLGAGFSYKNPTKHSALPSGDELRDILLSQCGKAAGARTSLKDAYLLAQRKIPDFDAFLESCFTVEKALPWQEKIFSYVWNRLYTTNIDNVLSVAYEQAKRTGKTAADFVFFNYVDPSIFGATIGSIPVVSIHGSIQRAKDGFIFSSLEYANATNKILDWHNELSAKMIVGGLIVIGNQLDEPDIEAHLASRNSKYINSNPGQNWIVMPNPDEIKHENYIAAGYKIIDATAEEFFKVVFATIKPKSIEDLLIETNSVIRQKFVNKQGMVWFKEAFNTVILEMEKARNQTGILRHFIMGAHPEWFYISNAAHAATQQIEKLTRAIAEQISANPTGVGILHVIGPAGSGKTTGIRASLATIVSTYPYVYEYDSENGIDVSLLGSMLESFTEKSIIVFYSAAEFYYAVDAVATRLRNKTKPYCLFVLEDRTNDFNTNKRQIVNCKTFSTLFKFGQLEQEDAKSIVEKIDEHGVVLDKFSNFPLDKRVRLLLDKERGYGGDLLSALYSLTTHENFETKIYEEYHSVRDSAACNILNIVAMMNFLGFSPPINYVAGSLGLRVEDVETALQNDLSGVVIFSPNGNRINCRHRVVAEYYFTRFIANNGKVDNILGVLNYLSRQFTIDDIKLHPLPYQIYKKLISIDFLYDVYFPNSDRAKYTEKTYHEAQKWYGKDGVFWLHFGRFYRTIGELDNAIDCFRTGLNYYDSFQTRHSLGTALLEKYIETNCVDEVCYGEGVQYLENERLQRGTTDSYPTSTLCNLLMKIRRVAPNNTDVETRLKQCINFGIKNFRGDEFFERITRDYFRAQ